MTPPPQQEPPAVAERVARARRRPGWLRRWVLRPVVWLLLLIVVALVVALWYVYRPTVQRRLVERLIPRIEEYLGREVKVGHVRYSLFPLWLELRDLSIGGPHPGDPPIVTARRIYVQAELRQLRHPILELQQVQAEGLEVYFHRLADGNDNWPWPKRMGNASKRPWELNITSFTVTDGVFHYRDETVPMNLGAEHVHVALLGMGGTDLQGRVVVESVEVALPGAHPYRAAVAGKLAVHADGIDIVSARATSPEATVAGRGVVRWRGDQRVEIKLDGSVDSALFRRLGYIHDEVAGWLQVDGLVTWKPGVWGWRGTARSSRLRALDWELADVQATVRGDRNAITADLDHARYAGGGVGGWAEVGFGAGGLRTRLELRLDRLDAERFLDDSHIPVGALATRLSGTVDYRFAAADWRRGQGWGELRAIADPDHARGVALAGTVPLVIDHGVVTAQAVRLVAPNLVVTGGVRYELQREVGSIDYQVQSGDLGPVAEALPIPPLADGGPPLWLPTKGTGQVAGTLRLAPAGIATDLRLDLTGAVARGLAADRATGTVALSGAGVTDLRLELSRGKGAALLAGRVGFARGAGWNLDLDVAAWPVEAAQPWLSFPLPVTGPFTGSVTLAGEGAVSRGSVAAEVTPATVGTLAVDRIRARLGWDEHALHAQQIAIGAPAGEVVAEGTMALPGDQLDLTVAASGLDLERRPFVDLLGGLHGVLGLTGTIGGTLARPAVRADLVAERLALAGQPLGDNGRAALRLDWDGDTVQADGSVLGLAALSGGGHLDPRRADLTFAVRADRLGALAGFAPAAAPSLAGSARGELRVRGPLPALELALRLDELAATVGGTPLLNRAPVQLRLAAGRLHFDSLYLATPQGESEVVLAGSVGLAAPTPLDLRLQGVVENAWVAPLLPGFQLKGSSDVLATIGGTAAAPRLSGQASLRPGGLLSSAALPEPIQDLQGVVLFYPDRMVVDRLQGTMGGGTLQGSGTLEWARPQAPASARFQVAARKVSLRWPEGWNLRGDGDLVWSLAGKDQVVRGAVTLDRAVYVRDVDLGLVQLLQKFFRRQRQEVGSADEALSAVQLNLQVSAPNTVRIRNNLADIKGTAELNFRGTFGRPVLFGHVEAESGGRLVYNNNTYHLERGTLTFANPFRIEPLLDIVATTRVSPYDVRMSLFGSLERLNASFSSDPPLPDLEVLSLLLSGTPTQLPDQLAQLTRPTDAAAANAGAEALLLGQAASLVTQRVGSLFGVDAFRVEPLSRSSGDSVSNARVTVGKRISGSVYVTYSYDPSATGGQRFQVQWQVSPRLSVLLTQAQNSYAVDMLWEQRF